MNAPSAIISQHTAAVDQLRAVLEKLGASDRRFAADLINTHERRGLSSNQAPWVLRLVERAATPKVAPQATALASNVSSIKKALDSAFARGLKRPALRLTIPHSRDEQYDNLYVFNRAPDTGKNPGCIYVKANGEYIGKIDGAGFAKTRSCQDEHEKALQHIATDPLGAAAASGKLTASCSCCGRPLSDSVSIQNGIGPVCQRKFFGE